MSATRQPGGIRLGDGLGDFMRFTSDAVSNDALSSAVAPGGDPGQVVESSRGSKLAGGAATMRPLRTAGAWSTGRH